MAFKVTSDCVVSKPGPVSTVHFRNLLKWKKESNGKECYGARLILSSVNNSSAYSIISFTYSDKDKFWVSLSRALGKDPRDKEYRKDLQNLLMAADTLTVRDLNDHSKSEVVSINYGDNDHPGPVFMDMLSDGQRKFLGNCTYIAFKRAGSSDSLPEKKEIVLEDIENSLDESDLEGI